MLVVGSGMLLGVDDEEEEEELGARDARDAYMRRSKSRSENYDSQSRSENTI